MTDESAKPNEETTENATALDSSEVQTAESPEVPATTEPVAAETPSEGANGPLNLSRIRELRKSQQAAPSKPKTDAASSPDAKAPPAEQKKKSHKPRPGRGGKPGKKDEVGVIQTPPAVAPKVEVPSLRSKSADLESELDQVLGGSDLDSMLIGEDRKSVV